MNSDLNRAKRKLDKKIKEAAAKGDLVRHAHLLKEKKELEKLELVKVQSTLAECMSDYKPEQRKEATIEVVYTIAIADILSGAIMDVLGLLKSKYGILDIPMLSKMDQIAKYYQEVVKSIDSLGSEIFSYKYMDVVEEVEKLCKTTLKETIHSVMTEQGKELL